MIIAAAKTIAEVTGQIPYKSGVFHDARTAKVNAEAVKATGGRLPCFAYQGKRSIQWASVNSRAGISKGQAREWLSRYGADLDQIEATAA